MAARRALAATSLLLASVLMAGCGGKEDAATDPTQSPAAEEEQSTADLIADLIASEEAARNPVADADRPVFPDDFLLNATEIPFEFQVPKFSVFGGEDAGLANNPGRIDAVVASRFLRPVPVEAWWTVANLRSSATTYLTIEALRWNSAADATTALATIQKTSDKCHWPDQSLDTIRGVYRNESVAVFLGFDVAQLEYAKLLLASLKAKTNLTEVCPLSYAGETVPTASTPTMAFSVTEATDRMAVTQIASTLNWTAVAIDSNVPVFVRVNSGAPVLVPVSGAVSAVGSKIVANDILEFCTSGTVSGLHVDIEAGGNIVQRYTFLIVDHKAWC